MEDLPGRLLAWSTAHIPNAIRIAIILVAAFVLTRAAQALIRRLERSVEDDDPDTLSDAEKRARTLGRILRQVVTILIWILVGVTVLSELGVSIGPVLAGAGIAGVAVGFGAQSLVKDVISGFFLLLENQFRVGDVVSLAGVTGQVEAVNLRTTVLRDLEGAVHVVPNGTISVVTNRTRGWSRAILDVGVAYREDTDRCYETLRHIGAELEKDPVFGAKLVAPFEYPGVEQLGESAVVLRMMVQTRPGEQWNVARELRRRTKKAFEESGIEIPFPHRKLYLHSADEDDDKGPDALDLPS
jgi:small conductance mechanosensitive channel